MPNPIVVVGSSNTDMIIKMDQLPKPGATILGGQFVTAAGGKGANQAVAAARAGGAVTFVARVGEDMFGSLAVAGCDLHSQSSPRPPVGGLVAQAGFHFNAQRSFLAFSCKSRWFCPSCHQCKVQTSAEFSTHHVLGPVPHRHYVLAIPKMLRPYSETNAPARAKHGKKRRKISSPPARACLHLPKMKAARKQLSLTGVSLKSEFLSLKSVCALLFVGFAAVAFRASATDVSSFMLGYSGKFYSTSVMHGTYAFNQIRITFDTDVFVDFYDLHLNAIAPGPYSIPLSGFSYNHVTHTAIWGVAGQPAQQNERFQTVLTGIWDSGGVPLTGGRYTNEFSVLTGDVSGDGHVSPADPLTIINHINNGNPYDPALDINRDGSISPLDVLLMINILNAGPPILVVGQYSAVTNDPPANLRIAGIGCQGNVITLQFSGLPVGSLLKVEGKRVLSESDWYPIRDVFVTNRVDRVSFPMLSTAPGEFYRASFQ